MVQCYVGELKLAGPTMGGGEEQGVGGGQGGQDPPVWPDYLLT